MTSLSPEARQAVEMFNAGHACSQSVLAAFVDRYNLSRDTALQMSCSLAGGFGGSGLTCGAVTGALLVLGLHAGRIDPTDQAARDRTDSLVQAFLERFRAQHGSLICNELTGIDHADVQARAQAKEDGIFDSVCTKLVEQAAQIVGEIIEED